MSEVRTQFADAVNMTPKELEHWLGTDEAQQVGQKKDGHDESTGHESGRRIVTILEKKQSDLTEDDHAHMRKVNGYVKRHLAQRPDKPDDELSGMTWTHSLKNWGHDPLKG